MDEIKSLTALRGICAMWVLCLHISMSLPFGGGIEMPIVSRGYLAVDFFFVLSGFILSRVHGRTFATGWRIEDYMRFAAKRFWRLFPLHWIVLAVALLKLAGRDRPMPAPLYLVGEFLLIHRWNLWPAAPNAVNFPDWSISTEWAANLLFPLFIYLGLRGRLAAGIMAAGATASLVIVAIRNDWTIDITRASSWFPLARCFAEFGLGIVLSRVKIPSWLSRDETIIGLAALLFVFLTLKIDLAAVAILVLLLAALAPERSAASRLLSARPLHWLGTVSYSIYLIQIPIRQVVLSLANAVPGPTTAIYIVGTIVSVLAVSYVSHTLVETGVPLLARKWRRPPAPPLAYTDFGL